MLVSASVHSNPLLFVSQYLLGKEVIALKQLANSVLGGSIARSAFQ